MKNYIKPNETRISCTYFELHQKQMRKIEILLGGFHSISISLVSFPPSLASSVNSLYGTPECFNKKNRNHIQKLKGIFHHRIYLIAGIIVISNLTVLVVFACVTVSVSLIEIFVADII